MPISDQYDLMKAEIARLRAALEDKIRIEKLWIEHDKIRDTKMDTLRAALEPFARRADALSLSKALGHIERKHLLNARKALANEP